jgi:hypothetical protein
VDGCGVPVDFSMTDSIQGDMVSRRSGICIVGAGEPGWRR